MNLLRSVLVSVLLTMLMARYFYEQTPEGFSQPLLIRALGMPLKICFDMGTVGYSIGLSTGFLARTCMEATAKLIPYISPPRCNYTDMYIEGIRVRKYEAPRKKKGELIRTIIYFHGGGWTVGSIETHSDVTDRLANDLNAMVFSVNYRLAPEHPFPAAFEDSVTVTKYLFRNAKTYNIDAMRIGLMGDSAGGNLAAAVSIKLRDDNFKPQPKLQVLIYPSLQFFNTKSPSFLFNKHAIMLQRRWCLECFSNYAFGHWKYMKIIDANNHTSPSIKKELSEKHMNLDILPHDIIKRKYEPQPVNQGNESFWNAHKKLLMNPYLNPLSADDFTRLPPAYISSCKNDPIRDDSYFYERRLRDAKVDVEHIRLNTCTHAWLSGAPLINEFDTFFRDMVAFLAKSL